MTQSRGHLVELQSLRGLAALSVVLHHCGFYYSYNATAKMVSEVLTNAHAAVVVFFVLSGYVLSLSMIRKGVTPAEVAGFYVRRVFRIYPALYVSLVLALGYVVVFAGHPLGANVSPWWSGEHRSYPQMFQMIQSVAGISTPLTVPMWTLCIELCASAILPLVVLAGLKRPASVWVGAMAYIAVTLVIGNRFRDVLLYFGEFLFGATIAFNLPRKVAHVRLVALAGFLVLWFGRYLFDSDFGEHYHNAPSIVVEGLGATVVVWAIACEPQAFAVLRHRWLEWLGDVSYSVYLTHISVLGLIAGFGTEIFKLPFMTGTGIGPTLALIPATLVVTLALSWLIYTFVEVPMVGVGKMIAKVVERRVRNGFIRSELAA